MLSGYNINKRRGENVMGRLYQAKYKKEFLKENPNSNHIYKWLFGKTFDYEMKFGRDLFDFSKDQILEFYKSRNMALGTLEVQISFLSTYINWAIKKGYSFFKNNPVEEIKKTDLEKIAKTTKNVLHKDVIYDLVGKNEEQNKTFRLKNAQDRLLVYLLFLGVFGERAHELRNLQFKHIENGVIKLSEIDPDRKDITIDSFGMQLVENAKNEKFYERYLDEDRKNYNDHDYDLDNSDYVFRKSTIGKYSSDERITYQALLARLSTMSKYSGEKLTMKRIQKSGMVYVGKLLKDKLGELDRNDPIVKKSLFERFNIQNERMQYRTIKEIEKEIKEVYENEEKEKNEWVNVKRGCRK